jgi:hypothetical protein
MAVILNITYSKKLGLPGYSSHSCSVSLTVEIDRKEMAAEESAKLYSLLQSAVDENIKTVGWMPDTGAYGLPENGAGNNGHSNGNGKAPPFRWSCTEGQKNFINRLVQEHSLNKDDVEGTAQQMFNTSVRQLNKMQASQLIEHLLEHTGQPPQRNRWRKPQPANGS